MARTQRRIVFDAHVNRALAIGQNFSPNENAAARTAFQGRRFRLVLTSGILEEYHSEATKAPQFQLQPLLQGLTDNGRGILIQDHQLSTVNIQLESWPREHRAFVIDTIRAGADYFVTNRRSWIDLSGQTERSHGLRIVSPKRFVELES